MKNLNHIQILKSAKMKWKNQLITQFKLGYTCVKIARLISADKIRYFFLRKLTLTKSFWFERLTPAYNLVII